MIKNLLTILLLEHHNQINNYPMFKFFKKDPVKKLEKAYQALLEEAMNLQRNGDIKGYALKMEEAEKIQKQIEEISN